VAENTLMVAGSKMSEFLAGGRGSEVGDKGGKVYDSKAVTGRKAEHENFRYICIVKQADE